MSLLFHVKTDKRATGDLGEDIACKFLMKQGFDILDRNYSRKWGELDIIAKKSNQIHFIEVKTVSHVTFRPEENMHPWKLRRLSRIIQTYMLHKKLDCEWQLDLITVKLDKDKRQARVELIDNIIL